MSFGETVGVMLICLHLELSKSPTLLDPSVSSGHLPMSGGANVVGNHEANDVDISKSSTKNRGKRPRYTPGGVVELWRNGGGDADLSAFGIEQITYAAGPLRPFMKCVEIFGHLHRISP